MFLINFIFSEISKPSVFFSFFPNRILINSWNWQKVHQRIKLFKSIAISWRVSGDGNYFCKPEYQIPYTFGLFPFAKHMKRSCTPLKLNWFLKDCIIIKQKKFTDYVGKIHNGLEYWLRDVWDRGSCPGCTGKKICIENGESQPNGARKSPNLNGSHEINKPSQYSQGLWCGVQRGVDDAGYGILRGVKSDLLFPRIQCPKKLKFHSFNFLSNRWGRHDFCW